VSDTSDVDLILRIGSASVEADRKQHSVNLRQSPWSHGFGDIENYGLNSVGRQFFGAGVRSRGRPDRETFLSPCLRNSTAQIAAAHHEAVCRSHCQFALTVEKKTEMNHRIRYRFASLAFGKVQEHQWADSLDYAGQKAADGLCKTPLQT
jgi:hypothetical protein